MDNEVEELLEICKTEDVNPENDAFPPNWTHVTAFFPIREEEGNTNPESFIPVEDYLKYGEILLGNDVNMYIFTTPEMESWVVNARRDLMHKTRIVTLEIRNLSYFDNLDLVTILHENDKRMLNCDKFKYTPLYHVVIWNKFNFLEKAIKENHFSSSNFSWVDFRIMNFDQERKTGFLRRVESKGNSKIHFALMNHCPKIESEKDFIKSEQGSISGMLFYGQKLHLERFVDWAIRKTKECLFEHAWLTSEQNICALYVSGNKEDVSIQICDYVDTISNVDYIAQDNFRNLEYCLSGSKREGDTVLQEKYLKVGLRSLIMRKHTMNQDIYLNVCLCLWRILSGSDKEKLKTVLWRLYRDALCEFDHETVRYHILKGSVYSKV